MAGRSRLRIIAAEEALAGSASPAFERSARAAAVGDEKHVGVVATALALARRGVLVCMPPRARAELDPAFAVAHAWVLGAASLRDVEKARADAFSALPLIERLTLDAVKEAIALTQRIRYTELDQHADKVVRRHVGLAASYASGALLLALDAAGSPALAAAVPQQVAGAIAYQSSALGPARSQELRARACEIAAWEAERVGTDEDHGTGALAIQLFHEFLGAHWRDAHLAERLHLDDFVAWVLAPFEN